jgi:ketosteroid isomerase-like protein
MRILSVLLLIASTTLAQPTPSDDVAELTRLLNEFLAGASGNNAAVHDRFWADDLIYTGSSGRRIGKADIMKDVRGASPAKPGEPSTVFTAEDVRIQQYGTTAVVAFRLVGTTASEGKTIVSKYFNTGTFLKRKNKWQVVSWQATKIPRSDDDAKKEVAAAEAAFQQAALAGDVKKLESILDDTFIWTDPAGKQTTRAQLLEAIGAGKLKYTTPETKDVVVNVYGDAAVARSIDTMTFVNKGGVWKAVAMHSSRPN